jgi:hypothetical protein
MSTDLDNENNISIAITKVSTFKYRDNFFKSPIKDNSSHHTLIENEFQSPSSPFLIKRRKDALGTIIKKGGKDHKVTFCDQINETDLAKKYIFRQKTPDIKNIKFNLNKKDSKKIKNKNNYGNNINYKNFNNKKINCNSPLKNNNLYIKNNNKTITKCESCFIF